MDFGKIAAIVAFIGAIVGSVYAMEERYASTKELSKKADTATVAQLQYSIMLDKKDELDLKVFILEQKSNRSQIEEYELVKSKERLENVQRMLSE